eukprot:g25792.t1
MIWSQAVCCWPTITEAQRAAPPPKEVKPLPRQVPHRKDRERRGPVSQSKVGSVKDKQDEVHKKPKVTKSGQTKTSVDRAPKPRPELREASEATTETTC